MLAVRCLCTPHRIREIVQRRIFRIVAVDASGQAQCLLAIPNSPLLVGLTTFVAGITWEPGYAWGIKKWSPPVSVTALP